MEEIPGFASWTAGTYADFMATDNVYARGVPTWITSGENAGRVKVGDGVSRWSQIQFADAALWTAIDAVGGKGGFLDPHNFGTATPTMRQLLEYACPDIWDAGGVFTYNSATPSASTYVIYGVTHTAVEIFSGTSVINTYNNLNDEWKLANSPGTTPPVFVWMNLGEGTVASASETYEGVAKLATTAQAVAGANDTTIMTPLKVKQAIAAGGGGGGIIPTTAPSTNPPAGSASIWASGASVEPPFIGIRYPNGTSKYIYGGSGPVPPPPSSSYLTLAGGGTVPITAADLPSPGLCGNGGATTQITVGGQSITKNTITGAVFNAAEFGNVTSIDPYFCRYFTALVSIDLSGFTSLQSTGYAFITECTAFNGALTLPSGLTGIGAYFLADCSAFNQAFTIPSGVTSIGDNFLSYCDAFDKAITLPSGLQSIGDGFLSACIAFNKPLTIPASVTSIGISFLPNCESMISLITVNTPATNFAESDYSFFVNDNTVPAYVTGMRIGGTYEAAVIARFPNSTTSPYRKLIADTPPPPPPLSSYLTLNDGSTVSITADDLNNNGLYNGGGYTTQITVGGQQVLKSTIVGAVFAAAEFSGVTALLDSFCVSFSALTSIDLSGFTGLQTIGGYFLHYCTSFNQAFTLPSGLQSIGFGFLSNCTSFNQPLTIPASVTSISYSFLIYCYAFNQPLTIPASVTSIDVSFLNDCRNMTSLITVETPATNFATSPSSFAVTDNTVPAYTTGMMVGGTYGADVIAAFQNSTTSPFRKLRAPSSYLTLADESIVPITAADLNSDGLCNFGVSTIVVGGQVIAKNTIVGAVFNAAEFGTVTSIPSYFCFYFTALTSIDLSGFTGLQTILDYFLANCTAFNHAFTIPASVTSIGSYFFYQCNNMTALITIETPAASFGEGNQSFAVLDNTVPAYTTGIRVGGIYGVDVKARFPDRTTSPFRKLIADAPPSSSSYLTLNDGTTVSITAADLPNLCNTEYTVTINGQTITKNTITGAVFAASEFGGVDTIPAYFCYLFTALTTLDFSGFTGLQSIGSAFLYFCTSFNQPLTVPSSVTSIGNAFLSGCYQFNQPLTVPSSVTSIATLFLYNCNNMTSLITVETPATNFETDNYSFAVDVNTVPAYTTGMRVGGTYGADVRARFPDSTTNPFRKLIAPQRRRYGRKNGR